MAPAGAQFERTLKGRDMLRHLKVARNRALLQMFHTLQRFNVDVLPRHFYSEIPDIARLRRETHWRRPYSMVGINGTDIGAQLEYLRAILPADVRTRIEAEDVYAAACTQNGEEGYGRVEADVLYGVVRTTRPRRIVQIGCGVSTAIILAAADDAGYMPELLAVDPHPTQYLQRLAAAKRIEVTARPVETLDEAPLVNLESGDLFFVDSSHTLGPAGEVSRVVLELLPRLKPGVLVHFHDIFFPYDYRNDVLDEALFFWHESALLHAFLVNNDRFKILASLSMLHHQASGELSSLVRSYVRREMVDGLGVGPGHFPSSLYLRTVQRNPGN